MSKIAISLLLLSTAACLWQQSEAKPFFFLPKNFFVLTTRAPSTDTRASSSISTSFSTSSSYGGDFQLPTAIISKKISFITSLLSILGGGLGGGGGGGSIGGGCGFGVNFNGPTSTSRPKTTSEPDAVFEIEPSTTTKAPTSTEKVSTTTTTTNTTDPSIVNKEIEATTETDLVNHEKESTITADTEESVVEKEVDEPTSTGDLVNNEKESTTSTEKANIDEIVDTTPTVGDLEKEPTTSAEKVIIDLEVESTPGTTNTDNERLTTTTPASIEDVGVTESTDSKAPIRTENESTTSRATDSVNASTESTVERDFTINIKPTVAPQQPALIKTTTKSVVYDITNNNDLPKVSLTGAINPSTGSVSGGFEIITLGGKDDTQKVDTIMTNGQGDIEVTNSASKADRESSYNYQPNSEIDKESNLEIQNEIPSGNVNKMYLPVA